MTRCLKSGHQELLYVFTITRGLQSKYNFSYFLCQLFASFSKNNYFCSVNVSLQLPFIKFKANLLRLEIINKYIEYISAGAGSMLSIIDNCDMTFNVGNCLNNGQLTNVDDVYATIPLHERLRPINIYK